MDVAAYRRQICVRFHGNAVKSPLEDMAGGPMALVKPVAVDAVDALRNRGVTPILKNSEGVWDRASATGQKASSFILLCPRRLDSFSERV